MEESSKRGERVKETFSSLEEEDFLLFPDVLSISLNV
jgi:hypothetical protein